MWYFFQSTSKLTEILGILSRSSLLKIDKTVQLFNISVNFKYTKKVDILKNSMDFQCNFSTIGNQRRYSSRLSITKFIGTIKENQSFCVLFIRKMIYF